MKQIKIIKNIIKEYFNDDEQFYSNSTYKFDYNCVYPKNRTELNFIINNMKPITASTFLRNVKLDEINNALMYGIKYNNHKHIKNDYAMNFYRIKKNNIDAYILQNSGIEYVFKKD